jgi:hypothetical protein
MSLGAALAALSVGVLAPAPTGASVQPPGKGSCRVQLRMTDDWENWTFYARAVTVGGRA